MNRRYEDFYQGPEERQCTAAPAPALRSTTPLPRITPKHRRITPDPERPPDRKEEEDVSAVPPFPQIFSPAVLKKTEASLSLSNTDRLKSLAKLCPSEQEPPQSPSSLSQDSLSDFSHPSSLSSLVLTSGRSSSLSDRSSGPKGIICSLHSSPVQSSPLQSSPLQTSPLQTSPLQTSPLQTSPLQSSPLQTSPLQSSPLQSSPLQSSPLQTSPLQPSPLQSSPLQSSPLQSSPLQSSHVTSYRASLPRSSPTNLSTSDLIGPRLSGRTKPLPPLTSPGLVFEPEDDEETVQKSLREESQLIATPDGANSSRGPPMRTDDALSLTVCPSPSVRAQRSLWPILPPISTAQERCSPVICCSSEPSCTQSQVFDELDAIAPLSASSSSMDHLSESSDPASKVTDVSPGLAALTVGCDSGNLGSLSRVQLLLLNRPEPDAGSRFSLEEDTLALDNYIDLDRKNGVWRPLTAGSISEKCGSIETDHQNKWDDLEGYSGSPCSWIIDQSPSYDMFKSSDSQSNSRLGCSEDEEASFDTQPNYWRLNQEGEETCSTMGRTEKERVRKREEKQTKVLKMLSKLQDDAPPQTTSSKAHSDFEDFDFLAKYCIFNQEKLAEYRQAFEEVLFALKNIVPPELLSEEEEIYVYRILETVDFRVADGLVDFRLFAVVASLAHKIATMDEFMRSLISSIDFRSLEVKLFKAKALFLFLLEEQTDDGTSQQKYISPEQLVLELKAGGICLDQEAAIRTELQHIAPLDLLDFLAYLPLFMLIHRSVIANPLDDCCHS